MIIQAIKDYRIKKEEERRTKAIKTHDNMQNQMEEARRTRIQKFQLLKQRGISNGQLFVKLLDGKHITLSYNFTDRIEEIKDKIQDQVGIPLGMQRLIYVGYNLEDVSTPEEYGILPDTTIHLVYRLRGGDRPERHVSHSEDNKPKTGNARVSLDLDPTDFNLIDLIEIQCADGFWMFDDPFPIFSKFDQKEINELKSKIDQFIDKLQQIGKIEQISQKKKDSLIQKKLVATLLALLMMNKFMMPFYEMWKLIYQKAIDWLQIIDPSINWEELLKKELEKPEKYFQIAEN